MFVSVPMMGALLCVEHIVEASDSHNDGPSGGRYGFPRGSRRRRREGTHSADIGNEKYPPGKQMGNTL
eukprot:6212125-Pleurochrysis_carterae.AAC.4